jgi:hypothetical protein
MPTLARPIAAAIIVLGSLICAHLAQAEPTGAGGEWAHRATSEEIAAGAPEAARTGQGGRAVARCHVEDSGELSGCVVLRETPAGQGIGAALLALSPKFRRTPPGPKDLREVVIDADWFRVDAPTSWQRRPSPEQLLAVYPTRAERAGGHAVVSCLVTVQGALTDCEAVSERPAGLGFGDAAIALAPQLMMKPVTWRGAPARTTVRIPISWEGYDSLPAGLEVRRIVPGSMAWAEAPTFADVSAAYPSKARAQRRAGHAVLSCGIDEGGRLSRCLVRGTDPTGLGFERAAKTLADKFRLNVVTDADRKATRNVAVHLPLTFDPAALDGAVIGRPNWAILPGAAQLRAAFFPLKLGGTTRVSLTCVVQAGGSLGDCAVVSEQPAGLGAGAAALSLAPSFRVTTWTDEGLPVVGGRVTIPLRYEPEAAAPPQPK